METERSGLVLDPFQTVCLGGSTHLEGLRLLVFLAADDHGKKDPRQLVCGGGDAFSFAKPALHSPAKLTQLAFGMGHPMRRQSHRRGRTSE